MIHKRLLEGIKSTYLKRSMLAVGVMAISAAAIVILIVAAKKKKKK